MNKHFVVAAPCPKANSTVLKFILYFYCIFVSSVQRAISSSYSSRHSDSNKSICNSSSRSSCRISQDQNNNNND